MNNIFYTFSTIDDGNIAYHVTNEYNKVTNNRKKLCKKFHLNFKNLKSMEQIHSNIVKIVDDNTTYKQCDGIITDKIDTPLMVMVADCIPILFYEPFKNIVGVAHAGRNGTYENICSVMIHTMIENYNLDVKNIHVVFGPSIQKCCYEVSDELALIAKKSFGEDVINGRNVDLQTINKKQLLSLGIKKENIKDSKICTKCEHKKYFSYRDDHTTGRFCGIINMRQNI